MRKNDKGKEKDKMLKIQCFFFLVFIFYSFYSCHKICLVFNFLFFSYFFIFFIFFNKITHLRGPYGVLIKKVIIIIFLLYFVFQKFCQLPIFILGKYVSRFFFFKFFNFFIISVSKFCFLMRENNKMIDQKDDPGQKRK